MSWRTLASNIPLPEQNLLGIAAGLLLQRVLPLRLGGGTNRVAPGTGRPGTRRPHAGGQRLAGQQVIGLGAMAAGCFVIGWSWAAARGTRLADPGVLVTSGPYALCRNPMYVGWSLLHLGMGLVRDDAWTIAALPFSAAAVHRQVLREESQLADKFGDRFRCYERSVPRYVPAFVSRGRGWCRSAGLARVHRSG
ncbi:isoprenylcysteine carboxylmethyltransferase family protein [Arthrobacter sp. Y81]|uniref:methyltransferase family protein n=1 Tax=Arthrobacter sp. Y81 TaxID=2058897 RepID=UPI000CE2EA96|nr:isoprenylcysteine carboxylmethyltransferase family protein [Arthrobacter sp. Y81]